MKRTSALAAAALAVLLPLSACTVGDNNSGSNQGGDKKEVSFLVFETPNLTPAYWDAAIKRVTDKHSDITVKKLVSPDADRTNYAKQLLTSGQFPDVMIAVSPAGFAEGGNLAAFSEDELKDFLYPKNGAINGKVYQLPANTQTVPVVYYNKKLFADAGITSTPKTYADLLDACAKLKAKNITPIVSGGGKDTVGQAWAGLIGTDMYAKNPEWMHQRRAGTVKFNNPDFIKAATKFADLAKQGYIDKKDLSRDYAAAQQAFLDGKGAMYPMGNWFAAAADDPKTKPQWEVGQFNWPSDDGKNVVPAFTGGGLVVSATAKNLDAAKKFALAFQLDKGNLDNSVKADGLIPAIKDYSPPTDVGPTFKSGFDAFQAGLKENAVIPSFGSEAGDDALLPGLRDKWLASAADLITGKKTPEQVAAFLDAEWDKAS